MMRGLRFVADPTFPTIYSVDDPKLEFRKPGRELSLLAGPVSVLPFD